MREDVDPRIDKMIACLYGELSPAEERSFREMLAKDATLRAEFEELSRARAVLAGWKVEERVPSFVLVESAAAQPMAAPASVPGPRLAPRQATESPFRRVMEVIRGFGASPAWGMAAAAIALCILAGAGFRVEKVQGGVAFRFGGSRPAATERVLPGVGEGEPLELARPTVPGGNALGSQVVPVSGSYLTRDEFNSYNTQLMTTLAQLLNRYDEQRDREVTDLMQTLYRRINDQAVYNYERVNHRIDALGEDLQTQAPSANRPDVRKNPNAPAPTPGSAGKTGGE